MIPIKSTTKEKAVYTVLLILGLIVTISSFILFMYSINLYFSEFSERGIYYTWLMVSGFLLFLGTYWSTIFIAALSTGNKIQRWFV